MVGPFTTTTLGLPSLNGPGLIPKDSRSLHSLFLNIQAPHRTDSSKQKYKFKNCGAKLHQQSGLGVSEGPF